MKQTSAPARNMIFVSYANLEENEFARWITLQLAIAMDLSTARFGVVPKFETRD